MIQVSMMITVLLFAGYRQQLNTRQLTLDIPDSETPFTVRDLAHEISERYHVSFSGALCAVNEVYVSPEHTLTGGETVAFFPPVSGGEATPGVAVR